MSRLTSELAEALERAYVFMLMSDMPYRSTLEGQADLSAARDALAKWRNEDIEETQCEYKARAALQKAKGS